MSFLLQMSAMSAMAVSMVLSDTCQFPDAPLVVLEVAAVPCSVLLVDIASDVLAVHSIVSGRLCASEDVAALLHRQVSGHVVHKDLVYLLAASAGALVVRDVRVRGQCRSTHYHHAPLHCLLRLCP